MTLTHTQAVIVMVANAAMWSMAGVVTRQLDAAHGFEITFWRSVFTVMSLLVLLPLMQGRQVFAQMLGAGRLLWLSGLCWSVMFTAFMMALTLTTVANVLITLSIGPLLTALVARWTLKHPIALRTWVAIAVAGAGIAWMFADQLGGEGWLGSLVALAVPIASATHWTIVQHASQRGLQIDLVPAVLVGALLSALYTLPMAWPLSASSHVTRPRAARPSARCTRPTATHPPARRAPDRSATLAGWHAGRWSNVWPTQWVPPAPPTSPASPRRRVDRQTSRQCPHPPLQ